MDTKSEISVTYNYPTIYQVNLEKSPPNEVLSTLSEEVLQGCTHSAVESALVDYVTSVIDPVGWRAVWRSTNKSFTFAVEYDFAVEVINVSLEKLEADVLIQSVIVTDPSINVENLRQVKNDVSITAPLIELYTISEGDEEELYLNTALAIEYTRLFLMHLKRPWDGEDDIKYTEEVLKPRLLLHFDMKNNLIPKAMISKVKMILKQATKVQNELDSLYSEMHVSDSEAEINEEDFMQSITLKEKLGELQIKMEMLENPVIRSFVKKKYAPGRIAKRRHTSGGQSPVTYIVSKQFSFNMIANLSLEPDTMLEFEHSPETAFKCCTSGDKIIIFPGVYQCDTLGWLEDSVSVIGIGSSNDIVIEATGNSDVVINCCARNISLQNISLKAKYGLLSAIVVHHGKVHLKNCIIDSNKADVGVMLLGGAEAVLENSIVCNSQEDGILMKSLSSLDLLSSKVRLCQRYGLHIDAENEYSTESFTDLVITNSCINENGSYGIYLADVPITEISLNQLSNDLNVLQRLPWLKHKVENIDIGNNGKRGVGVSSAFKSNRPRISDAISQAFPLPEELNYSALSELLNAVNLSMELETQHLYN